MSFEDDTVTLEVKDTVPADAGDYKFTAVNKVSEVNSQASLTVHGKMQEGDKDGKTGNSH